MIQRIQSLYLGLALLLSFALFALPFAVFTGDTAEQYLYMFEVVGGETQSTIVYLLPGLTLLGVILLAATVGLFGNRKLQMRLCHLSLIVQLGITVAAIFIANQLLPAGFDYSLSTLIPVISSLFIWLASRAIKKDDKLIKSVDRLR